MSTPKPATSRAEQPQTLRTRRRADRAVTGASAANAAAQAGTAGRLQGIDPQGKAPPQVQTPSQPSLPISPCARPPARRRLHVLLLRLGQMLQPLVDLLGCHRFGHLLTRRVRPPRSQQKTPGASAWEHRGGSRERGLREAKDSNFLWQSCPGNGWNEWAERAGLGLAQAR